MDAPTGVAKVPASSSSNASSSNSAKMKPPKTEQLSVGTPTKTPTKTPTRKTPLSLKVSSSPLVKPYLSKSYENLSSQQKKTLSTHVEHRPKSSLGLPKTDTNGRHNKENVRSKDKGVFLKPKPVKTPSTPIRKSSSTQNIDKTGATSTTVRVPAHPSRMQAMKRAHSSQNVSNKQTRKRSSAPTSDVMAYNAELLANFEKDKKNLEGRISELIQVAENRKAEIEKYKYETKRLKEQIPAHDYKDELKYLRIENQTYKDRLKELGFPVDQSTDSEKLSRLKNATGSSHKKSKSSGDSASVDLSMPKSVSCDSLSTDDMRGVNTLGSLSKVDGMDRSVASEPGLSLSDVCARLPEHALEISNNAWEKGSNKSSDALSEISVACLTERILHMEETHYSTNEELQATLQELGDLQQNVNELTDENERLFTERNVLLESLCTQTEKLEHCRIQIEQLKSLLISGKLPDQSDRELQLIDLLKAGQIEREEVFCKQSELVNALRRCETELNVMYDTADSTRDKSMMLEENIATVNAEKEELEKEKTDMKDLISNHKIEIGHYKTLLENEKAKVQELEQYCKMSEQSDLEELLHNTRQEKDKLEEKCANTTESLLLCKCEIQKLKENLASRDEEIKLVKNNTKSQLTDYDFKFEKVENDRSVLRAELENGQEKLTRLEAKCHRLEEEKNKLETEVEKKQSEVLKVQQERDKVKVDLGEIQDKYRQESDEWEQFQKDLQTAVLVANDFRVETQEDKEKIQQDNSSLADECQRLKQEVSKLKEDLDRHKMRRSIDDKGTPTSLIMSSAELKGKVINTVDRELSYLRTDKTNKNASQSVKSLIASIEMQVKSGCSSMHSSTCSSRRNSDTTDTSLREFQDMVKSPSSPSVDSLQSFGNATSTPDVTLRSALKKTEKQSPMRHSVGILNFDSPRSPSDGGPKSAPPVNKPDTSITSFLSNRREGVMRRKSSAK